MELELEVIVKYSVTVVVVPIILVLVPIFISRYRGVLQRWLLHGRCDVILNGHGLDVSNLVCNSCGMSLAHWPV